MLDRADPVVEGRLVVVGNDENGFLEDDRSAIERLVDEMNRRSTDPCAVLERVADRVSAGERRQQ